MEDKEFRLPQIIGEVFRPCFMTEKDFENGYRKSEFWTEKNFMETYREHMVAMGHVAECAKIYIYNNWEKITDWTGLDVIVKHGPTGELTEYYNYVPRNSTARGVRSDTVRDFFAEMEERDKLKHNPIRVLEKVVLDPTDGYFSLTINGKEHWWIQDEAVIIIADYIEQKLAENKIL